MINRYVEIIDQIKQEILSWTDELEDDYFVMGKDFMRNSYIIKKLMFQSV